MARAKGDKKKGGDAGERTGITKVTVEETLPVPFKNEEERERVIATIIENQVICSKLETQIGALRAKKKEPAEKLETALCELAQGKLVAVQVEEEINWDTGVVKRRRLDRNEPLADREVTAMERQRNLFDGQEGESTKTEGEDNAEKSTP